MFLGGLLPSPHQTWYTASAWQFSGGNSVKGWDPPLQSNHAHTYSCILSQGTSIQGLPYLGFGWGTSQVSPLYWRPQLRHFSPLWLSTFPLLFLFSLPSPLVHESIIGKGLLLGVLGRGTVLPSWAVSFRLLPSVILWRKMEHWGASASFGLLSALSHYVNKGLIVTFSWTRFPNWPSQHCSTVSSNLIALIYFSF